MYHIVYKTTNLLTNKVYVGIHSTNNLDDGYLGSGTHIKRAIKQYGKENFSRETIKIFNDRKSASDLERKIVTEDFCSNDNTYNLRTGGDNEYTHNISSVELMKTAATGKKKNKDHRNAISKAMKGKLYAKHTVEKIQITDETITKYVNADELETYLNNGWRKGHPKNISKEQYKNNAIKQSKTYTVIDPEGNKITFTGLNEFCREHGLTPSAMSLVLSGKRKRHKGYERGQ